MRFLSTDFHEICYSVIGIKITERMIAKQFALLLLCLLISGWSFAQTTHEVTASYATEFQTNFGSRYNWVNLVTLNAQLSTEKLGLWRNGAFKLCAISIYRLREVKVFNDLIGYSNIEEGNLPIAPFEFAYLHRFRKVELSGGLRNMNDDYFTSPYTLSYTNSASGNYPTISANFACANFPLSALGVHVNYSINPLFTLQSSLYNGVARSLRDGFAQLMRVDPKRDGVIAISELGFSNARLYASILNLGGLYQTPSRSEEGVVKRNFAVWANLEQGLYCRNKRGVGALLQLSIAPKHRNRCTNYLGVGGVFTGWLMPGGADRLSILLNSARFAQHRESALELTWSAEVVKGLVCQPALHLVKAGGQHGTIGMLRFVYSYTYCK